MTHDICLRLQWCKRCGRPLEDILANDIALCDGLPGVIHANYQRMLASSDAIFRPILKRLGIDLP